MRRARRRGHHRAAIWGALNLNVHLHALVVNGVFAKDGESVRFHPSPWLDAADVDEVLATVEAYVRRLLAGLGVDAGDDGGDTLDEWANDEPVLAGLAAASVQGRVALRPRAGARARRRGEGPAATEPPGLVRWTPLSRQFSGPDKLRPSSSSV